MAPPVLKPLMAKVKISSRPKARTPSATPRAAFAVWKTVYAVWLTGSARTATRVERETSREDAVKNFLLGAPDANRAAAEPAVGERGLPGQMRYGIEDMRPASQ